MEPSRLGFELGVCLGLELSNLGVCIGSKLFHELHDIAENDEFRPLQKSFDFKKRTTKKKQLITLLISSLLLGALQAVQVLQARLLIAMPTTCGTRNEPLQKSLRNGYIERTNSTPVKLTLGLRFFELYLFPSILLKTTLLGVETKTTLALTVISIFSVPTLFQKSHAKKCKDWLHFSLFQNRPIRLKLCGRFAAVIRRM